MGRPANTEADFWRRVKKHRNGCWEWTGGKSGGYGEFLLNRVGWLAHRFAWTILVGPIPPDKELDHLCRNRACVNPAHIEVVIKKSNILRGVGPSAQNARKTHCKRGHLLDGENLGRSKYGRFCKTCMAMLQKHWREKHPDKIKERWTRWYENHREERRAYERQRWQKRKAREAVW